MKKHKINPANPNFHQPAQYGPVLKLLVANGLTTIGVSYYSTLSPTAQQNIATRLAEHQNAASYAAWISSLLNNNENPATHPDPTPNQNRRNKKL